MIKRHLLAPGPTPVPEEARLAMAASLIHHRGPEFKEVLVEVFENLRWAHQTESDVVAIACTGTGGFEAALTAFTARGDTVISIGGGKFGERWGEMARAFGMNVVEIPVEWGRAVDPADVKQALDDHPDAAAVTMTVSETSTGVFHPVDEVAELVGPTDALFMVDGITAVGVHPLPMQEMGIDVLVSGSQKAFSVPPGMAFVAVRDDDVWRRADRSDHGSYYLDLVKERDAQRQHKTAFTSNISVTLALQVVLRGWREEGLASIWRRHGLLAGATRAGVEALGLELLAERPANSVTAAMVPDGVSAPDVVRIMREQHGVTIAGGQAHLKPRLIRIGHIGHFDRSDVVIALAALEAALDAVGAEIRPGAAVTAAQEVFLRS